MTVLEVGDLYPRDLLLSFCFVLLRAVIEELLIHLHEELEGVVDQAMDGSVIAKVKGCQLRTYTGSVQPVCLTGDTGKTHFHMSKISI